MPNQNLAIDDVFRALADPTRRAVIERLTHGPASMSELAKPFEMALPSLLQHLRTLEGSGVLASRKVGRVRTYSLQPQVLETAQTWLAKQQEVWSARLDQLDAHLLAMKVKSDT